MDKKNIAIACFAVAYAAERVARVQMTKKYTKQLEKSYRLAQAFERLAELNSVLAGKLDDHEVPLDEFDEIIIANI